MNNPFDYIPDRACREAFRELTLRLDALKESDSPEDVNFCRELEAGKMLGVLIASDDCGRKHTLYAFSGQLGNGGFSYRGFVGPVFDYLHPDGCFKKREAEISHQNHDIALFERETLPEIAGDYEIARKRVEAEIAGYKEKIRKSKQERKIRRESGEADEKELAEMIGQSQFEKAELHRLKKRMAATLKPFAGKLEDARSRLREMKEKRRCDSEALQKWLFSNFRVLNARGESRSLIEIFSAASLGIPPSGAGECCGPKLLQEAYLRGWHPESMAEFWYGKPKGGEVRIHGEHYPACRGKCLPVLGWMLEGLDVEPPLGSEYSAGKEYHPEIIYENEWFCVVDKPSGMLSVPGKGAAVSLQEWLGDKYGADRKVKMAHRLDRDTSGLIVATFGEPAYKRMQTLFATREVSKTYIAELEGDYESLGLPAKGTIDLPLSPDWLDRPRQRVDFAEGKPARTEYEFIGVSEGRSRVIFRPHTGRTHQLRVHAASEMGLGMSITGDPLYGRGAAKSSGRLRLHALRLEFTYPPGGQLYRFESDPPF